MFSAEWANGAWAAATGSVRSDRDPAGARALQYAELVFEGMKAYGAMTCGPRSAALAPQGRRQLCASLRASNAAVARV